jgi:heat shock protein HslJ
MRISNYFSLPLMLVSAVALLTISFSGALPARASDLDGFVWIAEDIAGGGVVDRARSTLQVREGRIAGSSGCNRYTGSGRFENGEVRIGAVATTRMACPPALMDQEAKFLKALAAAQRYEIGADGMLRLYNESGAATLRFSRQPPS